MKVEGSNVSYQRVTENPRLTSVSVQDIFNDYDECVELFHSLLDMPSGVRRNQIENAHFHKNRYRTLSEIVSGKKNILDVGNDKPFLSWILRKSEPEANFTTISFEVVGNPYETFAIDIETEAFNLGSECYDLILLAEVIEHLWRNPSNVIFEINQCISPEGQLYLTTPNACELHAIVNILWGNNPNQRQQYFRTLESGHLHLWTISELTTLLREHGLLVERVSTPSPYQYTDVKNEVASFAAKVSPFSELMGEQIEIFSRREKLIDAPVYPESIFPDRVPVQAEGAIVSMFKK